VLPSSVGGEPGDRSCRLSGRRPPPPCTRRGRPAIRTLERIAHLADRCETCSRQVRAALARAGRPDAGSTRRPRRRRWRSGRRWTGRRCTSNSRVCKWTQADAYERVAIYWVVARGGPAPQPAPGSFDDAPGVGIRASSGRRRTVRNPPPIRSWLDPRIHGHERTTSLLVRPPPKR
jgi:hypothetical protein